MPPPIPSGQVDLLVTNLIGYTLSFWILLIRTISPWALLLILLLKHEFKYRAPRNRNASSTTTTSRYMYQLNWFRCWSITVVLWSTSIRLLTPIVSYLRLFVPPIYCWDCPYWYFFTNVLSLMIANVECNLVILSIAHFTCNETRSKSDWLGSPCTVGLGVVGMKDVLTVQGAILNWSHD